MLYRNVASQKWIVFAFDETDATAKTGDAANITAKISKDGAAGSATNDTNPTELEDGYYVFDLTQAETDSNLLLIMPESSTADVAVIGVPGTIRPETGVSAFGTADSGTTTTIVDAALTQADDYWNGSIIHFLSGNAIGQSRLITDFVASTDTVTFAPALTSAAGTDDYEIRPWGNVDLVNTVTTLTGHTAQTGDSFARLGAPAGASVSADIATVDTVVDGIQTDLSNGTDGLGALKALIDTVDTVVDGIQTDLDNGTDGLGAIKADTAAILVDTADMQPKLGTVQDLGGGATIAANLDDMAGSTFSSASDSLEAIRDRGDAAWTTGAGGSDRLLMVDTTIATLASQTSFTLTAGSADDDAYNNCTIVVEDVSTSTQKAVGMVLDYTGSTKTVTLKEALAFTIATTDKVYILAENSLKSTVANRQLDVTATGAAGIDWGNVENPSSTVDLSATDIQLADTVTTLTGHTAQTGDSYARLGAPAGASVSADIATVDGNVDAILVDTADMQPKLGTVQDLGGGATFAANLDDIAGSSFSSTTDSLEAIRDRGDAAWTTGAGGSDRLLMVDTTIATLSTQTSFTLTAGSADDDAYNNCTIVVEDVSTSTQKAVGMVLDYTGSTKTVTLKEALAFTIAATDKVYILAENSLKSTVANRQLDVTATGAAGIDWGNVENPTTAVDLSATDIQLADTVSTLTGHTAQTGDSFARLGAPAGASVSADIATVDTVVDGIQTDLSNGTDGLGALKALIDTVDTVVDGIQTDLDNGTDGLGALKSLIDTVDSNVDAILVDTADMQPKLGTPAGASISADIATIDGNVDSILVDTNELQADWTNGGRLDLLIDAIKVVTDALGSTAAANLALSAGQMITFTVDTATNGHTPTTTEFQADDITEATADHYNGRIVIFTSGALAGQATDITDYAAVGGIGQFTVTAMTEAPANNDTGIIV